jgi:hypothetical protein
MERLRITGTDNVKTSPHRQVKAHAFHILLRNSFLFLSFLLQDVNAAEDVNLIFVNGNIYTANERRPCAEAIAVKTSADRFCRLKRRRETILRQ